MGDHYFPHIPVKMESNRNNSIFRLRKSKVVEPSLRYVAVTKFGLLGSSFFPLTKSECFYSIESSEGNETLGFHSEWSLTCYSSMQRPESRNSGGCSAGDGREIKIMNQNTTQGRSGKTDEIQIYLEGGPPSTGCYESGNVETSHNFPSTSVEPQSGNTSLNFISTPPSVKMPLQKLCKDNPNMFEDWRVGPNAKTFQCKFCSEVISCKQNLKLHILRSHPVDGEKLGVNIAKDLVCSYCGWFKRSKNELKKHMEVYHKATSLNFASTPPSVEMPLQKSLNNRRRMLEDCRVGPEKFQCPFCPQLKNTKKNMKYHILKSHRSDGEKMGLRLAEHLYCKICGNFNTGKINLEKHMRTHHNTETNGMSEKSIPEFSTADLQHESGNVETSHNLSSTLVESQSGNRPEFSFDPFVISDPCCGEHCDFIVV